jgi:hypothetical protein
MATCSNRMSTVRLRQWGIGSAFATSPAEVDSRLIAAYFLLGAVVFANNGAFSPPLVVMALFSFALVVDAFYRPAMRQLNRSALGLLLGLNWLLSLLRPPGLPGAWLTVPPLGLMLYFAFTLSGLAVVLNSLFRNTRSWHISALMLSYLGAGALQILLVPAPPIDVHWVQQAGSQALVGGINPYSMHIPNLYSSNDTQMFFGDARTDLVGYPYPPLSLLLTTLGWWIGGDVRWAMLGAQLTSALLLWKIARQRGHSDSIALGITGAWLLHPRSLFVLEQSWTEPIICAGWYALLLAASRPSSLRTFSHAAGWFLGAKQYSLLALPLLIRRDKYKAIFIGGVLTALTMVPFFLGHPRDFISGVAGPQFRQPFRPDALSVPALLDWAIGWKAPTSLLLIAWTGAVVLLIRPWKVRFEDDRVRALALSASVSFFALFLFAKASFCNYYYFVGALLLAAIATGKKQTMPSS